MTQFHVLKIGGSLLDLPDLTQRICHVVDLASPSMILGLVGGGQAANLVRQWDAMHQLQAQQSHALAVEAMQLNARLVASLGLPWSLVAATEDCQLGRINLVDPVAWFADDQTLPRRWSFTSDSMAARLATSIKAVKLTLLKSADAGGSDLVDADFGEASKSLKHVELVHLRADPPTCSKF